ncbi:MAG TPA: hypothetical protein VMO26_01770 [Vicinamibacterales bacterium]|nr:hypothetical protein [Vicinamibacterales bacterium]
MAKKKATAKSARKSATRKTAKTRRRRATARRSPARRSARRAGRARQREAALIQVWPTDPMGGVPAIQLAAPTLPGSSLATRIVAPAKAPPAQIHPVGTDGFRYWTAAEPLRRCAAFWGSAGATGWHPDLGASIPVRLDDGVDLNAFYARNDFPPEDVKQGLSFFHDTVVDANNGRRVTVFSGESPDVVAHELGHAVLDSIKPVLFELASIEAAAFHESFGDMSAVLTALQLPSVRQAVIEETAGSLRRNSSVSRVAEQLGFAIRQRSPSAVDRDSLRNAANSFVYVNPLTLPPSGPATQLTRAPHNFSRVFTGAFLEALGGMVTRLAARPGIDDVEEASLDMGRLLARAAADAPVSTQFLQAVAERMVLADTALFNGKYAEALTTAFVRRGLMPVRSLAAPEALSAATPARAGAAAARFSATAAGRAPGRATRAAATPVEVAVNGASMGLTAETVYVECPPVEEVGAPPLSPMGIAGRDITATPRMADVQAFVESLVVRGRVSITPAAGRRRGLAASLSEGRKHATHYLERRADGAVNLKRIAFECC